ncbi:MAG: hypothetical protein WDM79_09225 [Terricaulis sp.]
MMMFVWMCVMTSAFFPGGDRIASLNAASYQAQVRASIEAPRQLMTLGWVSRHDEPAPAPAANSVVHQRIRAAQEALNAIGAPAPKRRAAPRARQVAAA